MVGPRFSYRPKAVTVFGHWLLGAGTNKNDWGTSSYTKWQFAMAIGGGVDVNVSKLFAICAAQIDWLPIHSNLELQGANNLLQRRALPVWRGHQVLTKQPTPEFREGKTIGANATKYICRLSCGYRLDCTQTTWSWTPLTARLQVAGTEFLEKVAAAGFAT